MHYSTRTGPFLGTPNPGTLDVYFFKLAREMKWIGESAVFSDFLNGKPRVHQLVGGDAKPPLIQVVGGGDTVAIPKEFEEVLARDASGSGQIPQGYIMPEML